MTTVSELDYSNGYQDGWDDAEANLGHIKDYFAEIEELEAQRDAAWEYLKERDIHLLHEKCWCGPSRHMVPPK